MPGSEYRELYNGPFVPLNCFTGVLSPAVKNELHLAHLLLLRDPHSFMLGFYLNDEQNVGLALHSRCWPSWPQPACPRLQHSHPASAFPCS